MSLFQPRDKQEIQKRLDALDGPVKLVLFTEFLDCPTCETARKLVQELAGLSNRLTVEIHNRLIAEAKAAGYKVDKAPALVLEGPSGARVRFFGVPGGYEFAALLESLRDVASGQAALSPQTRQKLSGLAAPVHIQVFVTPTCPFCPAAVRAAHKLAVAFPQITADAVEADEFPELSRKYNVTGVPKVVINDRIEFSGAVPESLFADAVLRAVA